MPSRRRVLEVCTAGVVGAIAGCFGGPDDASGPETDAPDTSGGSGPTGGATATTGDDVSYVREWTGVTIEKGSGWIAELPDLEEASDLSYAVAAEESVAFDVYVFGDEHPKETYERWINAPSGMKFETNGTVGLSGVTARNVSGSVERTAFVDAGPKWVAVDHSDFNGGFPRAEVDGDSPEEITVDVSIRVVLAF